MVYSVNNVQCHHNIDVNGALWHEVHPHIDMVKHVFNTLSLHIVPNSMPNVCGSCQIIKSHRLPILHTHTRALSNLTRYMLKYGFLPL